MTVTRYRHWAWLAILAVLCTGILIALSSGRGPAHQAFATDPTDDAISVTGVGEATGTPDTLTADFGVLVRRSTVQKALDDMSAATNQLTAALKTDGVKDADITTNGLSLYPWHNRKTEQSGYTASQTVEARITPLDNAGKALSDAATSSGNVTIQGMFFDISNDDALMQTARSNAFADAKARATQYAQLAGRSLGRVEKIDETIDNGGPIYYGKDVAGAASGAAPVPISPGTQTLTLNVTVTFQMM
jgi:uncharacterized protein